MPPTIQERLSRVIDLLEEGLRIITDELGDPSAPKEEEKEPEADETTEGKPQETSDTPQDTEKSEGDASESDPESTEPAITDEDSESKGDDASSSEDAETAAKPEPEPPSKESEEQIPEKEETERRKPTLWENELKGAQIILGQARNWLENMPAERLRMTVIGGMRSIEKVIRQIVDNDIMPKSSFNFDENLGKPSFILEAVRALGVEVDISEDRMRAAVLVTSELAEMWNSETVIENLAEQGIVHGIGQKAVETVFGKKKFDRFVTIAEGSKPVSGVDAVIEDCLDIRDISGVPQEITKVKSDMKELNRFLPVTEGQVIVKKTPSEPGEPGCDVLGNPIPCIDGVDYPLPTVPNTRLSETGFELVSTINGCAYLEGDAVTVVDALVLSKGVNFSTGNVKTGVSVNVNGDVAAGFKIESAQDIMVKGTIEAAELIAKGNILIDGGIEGGKLIAAKNIDVKFINGGELYAQEIISIHGSVIQCKVDAKKVVLDGNHASIIGAEIYAWDEVSAAIIGSEMGVKTKIRLGAELLRLRGEVEQLEEAIRLREEKLGQFAKALNGLEKLQEKLGGALPNEKKETYINVKKGIKKIEIIIHKLKEKLAQTQEDLNTSESNKRFIRASEGVQPGTQIWMEEAEWKITQPIQKCTLCLIDGEIKQFEYENREDAASSQDSGDL